MKNVASFKGTLFWVAVVGDSIAGKGHHNLAAILCRLKGYAVLADSIGQFWTVLDDEILSIMGNAEISKAFAKNDGISVNSAPPLLSIPAAVRNNLTGCADLFAAVSRWVVLRCSAQRQHTFRQGQAQVLG